MAKPKIKTTIRTTGLAKHFYGQNPPPLVLPPITAELEIPIRMVPPSMVYVGMSISTDIDLARVIATEMEEIGEEEVKKAMNIAAVKLKAALDAAIKASVWKWPSGGARDIYDTGRLASSGGVTVEGLSLVVTYGAPYARLVHDGGYILPYGNPNARPVYMPGRPWISSTIYGGGPVPKFDFGAVIRDLA